MDPAARYPSLAGRVVFITGGASGIGAGLVRAFAAQGAQVGFVDVDAPAGRALADELNRELDEGLSEGFGHQAKEDEFKDQLQGALAGDPAPAARQAQPVPAAARPRQDTGAIGGARAPVTATVTATVTRPDRVHFEPCDITDTAALQATMARLGRALGPIGVLVNNAGSDQRHRLQEVTPAFFDHAVAVNLRHQFFAAQAVAPGMAALGGGSIINLGSTSWLIKAAGYPVYASCKAAVRGLTRALARELGPQGIRVNSLVPGWVMTSRQRALWVTPEAEQEIDTAQCLPGRLEVQDIAHMALFLASDAARMCTAQDFVVDGGWS